VGNADLVGGSAGGNGNGEREDDDEEGRGGGAPPGHRDGAEGEARSVRRVGGGAVGAARRGRGRDLGGAASGGEGGSQPGDPRAASGWPTS